ncbi:MAG TPA: methyl-accepting chemotaxis protein, partial [Gemmatimonadaceae bacterium]|nr:methyl-accepting chemotaxis protein [Gemmatimonadaceae bacterium]
MRQSTAAEGPDKREANGASDASDPSDAPGALAAPGADAPRVDAVIVRIGFAGAVLLFLALWFQRDVIATATSQEILIFGGLALGAAAILTAIVTNNVIIPSIAERSGDTTDVLRAMAKGDLTREPTVAAGDGESERVAAAARSAVSALRASIGEVRNATRDVSTRLQDLSIQCTAAMSIAQRATEASSGTARQGATLVELARGAHDDVGRVAKGAARVVEEARGQRAREARLQELSRESLNNLRSGTSALEALAQDVGSNADELGSLSGASEEIRSFVTLVRKMARQSKLLALNAAMEAARAGEQGSGFAVVASEVRRLARSSNDAADRTDQLVTDVLERLERVRGTSARAVETARLAREATAAGLSSLATLEQEAGRSMVLATAEEDDVSSVTATSEAALLRLDQLAREAESLVEALREAASTSGTQQSRV